MIKSRHALIWCNILQLTRLVIQSIKHVQRFCDWTFLIFFRCQRPSSQLIHNLCRRNLKMRETVFSQVKIKIWNWQKTETSTLDIWNDSQPENDKKKLIAPNFGKCTLCTITFIAEWFCIDWILLHSVLLHRSYISHSNTLLLID